jgi:hypothetical protein
MSKNAIGSIYRMMLGLALTISIALYAGAADETNAYDTVELKNGDKLTGTLLDNTFTLSTPYSLVTLKKEQIAAINPHSEGQEEDMVELNVGGTITGTIEERTLSFKLISGETISLDKKLCVRIILRRNE